MKMLLINNNKKLSWKNKGNWERSSLAIFIEVIFLINYINPVPIIIQNFIINYYYILL